MNLRLSSSVILVFKINAGTKTWKEFHYLWLRKGETLGRISGK